MSDLFDARQARRLGEQATQSTIQSVHRQLQSGLRSSIGFRKNPPPACMDPNLAYIDPNSIVRVIHSDLPPMLIGGLASLLFQMLHPLAMAGVAQHSRYQDEPLGRLERTAMFLGITTFGSQSEASQAIQRIRTIHGTVHGTTPDGRPYNANDPELIRWVHAAEVRCLLTASTVYGRRSYSALEQDSYVADMARVALDLGAVDVPRTVDELQEYLATVRPQLELSDEARVARNFLLRGVSRWPHEMATYGTLITAAQGVLPTWARKQLKIVSLPASDRLAVRPVARAVSLAMRWIVTPLD